MDLESLFSPELLAQLSLVKEALLGNPHVLDLVETAEEEAE